MIPLLILLLAIISILVILFNKKISKKVKIIIGISSLSAIVIMTILIPVIINNTYSRSSNNNSSYSLSWNEGFNELWAGTYSSKWDAEYVVRLVIGTDGNYNLRCGSNFHIATTYTGKYNRNFKYGESRSGLNYIIEDFRIIEFDNNSIKIAVVWNNPQGRETDYYTLYKKTLLIRYVN
ncbi:MAG: hypothetical protein FWB86_10225 [Treponema sp.]|nr:hypothetical protein [Treponema sp.]